MTVFFIAGASGHFGKIITSYLLAQGEKLRLLIRKDSLNKPEVKEFKEKGAEIIEGDLSNHELLVKELKNVQVVISSVIFPKDEFALLKAAQEAKVNLYIPSIWGNPTKNYSSQELIIKDMKESIIKAVEESGLNYLIIQHGPWLDNLTFLGFDYQNNRVELVGENKIGLIHTQDIVVLSYKLIQDQTFYNKTYYLETEKVSIGELIQLFEKNGKKFEVEKLSEKETLERFIKHTNPFNFVLALSYQLRMVITFGDKMYKGVEVDNKKLFPEYKGISAEEYVANYLNGKDKNIY